MNNKQLIIKLPEGEHAAFKAACARRKRSMNGALRELMEHYAKAKRP